MQVRARARLAARLGQTGVAPFVTARGVEVVDLLGGDALGAYARRGRWAVTVGDVIAPAMMIDFAVGEYLAQLAERRLRPVFVAVTDDGLFARRRFDVTEIADEAIIDLPAFSLAGSRRANIRHAVTSARRNGLAVLPYQPWQDEQLAEVSREWLSTKRGGELGFTLSRHGEVAAQVADGVTDLWCVADARGRIQAWCTWRHYLGGNARVIDVMRRRPSAPNPAMDFLIATTLELYRDAGLVQASLASVPRAHGRLAERVYPTRSLRAYKEKFAPRWEPRWLAVPRAWQRPFALAAVGGAYCPEGVVRAVRQNP